MIEIILTGIILFLVSFLPIVFWGYLFSFFDESIANKKRFLVGIFAGAVSVFPVLYLEELVGSFQISYLNVFSTVANISSWGDIGGLFISLFFLVLVLSFLPFIVFLQYENIQDMFKKYIKNTALFFVYMIFLAVFLLFGSSVGELFHLGEKSYNFGLSFGDVVFNSLKLIVFYYILIGLIEELSKFFCFQYSKLFTIVTIKQSVLYAMIVALGFSFVENILYFYKGFHSYGFGGELIGMYVSRNIFSIVLHVLCSSIFAYYFSRVYLQFQGKMKKEFIKILFVGFLLAVFLHALFNIFLTFGFTLFIFIYLIGAYFYLTYIYYKEN